MCFTKKTKPSTWPKYQKIIDTTPPIKTRYQKLIFCRNPTIIKKVPLWKWIWFWILEIFFGEELLENLVMTSTNNESLPLRLHIPGGFFTNCFRNQLIEMLYYKFYLQYLLLIPESEREWDEMREFLEKDATVPLDISNTRFWFKKCSLFQIIEFRRTYLLMAITMHSLNSTLFYTITHNEIWTISIAALLELLRRTSKAL